MGCLTDAWSQRAPVSLVCSRNRGPARSDDSDRVVRGLALTNSNQTGLMTATG